MLFANFMPKLWMCGFKVFLTMIKSVNVFVGTQKQMKMESVSCVFQLLASLLSETNQCLDTY